MKEADVIDALKNVTDPEIGINVVDLGLVYDVKIDGGEVRVNMTLTSPGCPVAPQIMADAENAVLKLKAAKKVHIEFIFDPPWTPEKMSEDAKIELGI